MPALVVGSAVTGVGMGLLFLMGTSLVAQNAPGSSRGEVFSALFVIAYLSLGVPAVVAALLSEVVGLTTAFHVMSVVVSVIAVGALLAVMRIRPPGRTVS